MNEAAKLALEAVNSRPVVETAYLSSIDISFMDTPDIQNLKSDLILSRSQPVYDYGLGVPPIEHYPAPRDDVGDIGTGVRTSETWRVNILLSHIPSYMRTLEKGLFVSSHFPSSGELELTLNRPVSENRMIEVKKRIESAKEEKQYLLFDANLPRHSDSGHLMPKSWLWDVYDELAWRLDKKYNTTDADNINPGSCLRVLDGKILYGMNYNGVYLDVNGFVILPEEIDEYSTKVTDEWSKRTADVLQGLYSEGCVVLLENYAMNVPMVKVSSRLHKPKHAMCPSMVELLYN